VFALHAIFKGCSCSGKHILHKRSTSVSYNTISGLRKQIIQKWGIIQVIHIETGNAFHGF
jgi:hypothetical protein